jgi:Family of unknown function (DUF6463)
MLGKVTPWLLFTLGIVHIIFGSVRFKSQLVEAISEGFIGQFRAPEVRRTAFWFLLGGPLIMLAGHVGVHAVAAGDLALVKIVGLYTLAVSILGIAAYPASPFWVSLIVSSLLVAVGFGVTR